MTRRNAGRPDLFLLVQPLYTTELTNDMPWAMTNTRSSQSCSSQTAAAIPSTPASRHGDGSHRKRNQRPERKLHLHRFRGLEQRRVLSLPHGNGLSISSGPRNPGAVPTQAKPPVNRVVSVLSRNPVYAYAQTGFLTYVRPNRRKIKEVQNSFHFHLASFFRFMAANLSFTQFVTWARPLY